MKRNTFKNQTEEYSEAEQKAAVYAIIISFAVIMLFFAFTASLLYFISI